MKIETLDEIINELADKMGIYGCCKKAEENEDCEEKNSFCCRVAFTWVYEDRIRKAIENEEKLKQIGLNP